MAHTHDSYPLMTDWDPAQRQRRINRRLDARFDALARIATAPLEDGSFPYINSVPAMGPRAAQAVTIDGQNFLQGHIKATLITDTGVANTQINWEAVRPGFGGNAVTLALVDTGALSVAVLGSAVTVNINAGVTTAAQIVAAVLADTSARVLLRGTAAGTGAGTPTASAAAALTGGVGRGTFDVVAPSVTAITRWTDTAIDVILDMSALSENSTAGVMVVANGIETVKDVLLQSPDVRATFDRVGSGYIAQNGVGADGETITIGTEIYELDTDGAGNFPGGGGTNTTIQVDISADQTAPAVITQLVAAIIANSAIVDAGNVAGADVASLAPQDTLTAGNYALATTGANTVVSGAAMTGGSVSSVVMAVPLQRAVVAQDVTRWAAGDYVPVFSFPSTTEPELYSISADRAGNIHSMANIQYRFAQLNTNYWALEVLDGVALFQAGDVIRVLLAA